MNLYLIGTSENFINFFKKKINDFELNNKIKLYYCEPLKLFNNSYIKILSDKIQRADFIIIDLYSFNEYNLIEIGMIISLRKNIPIILIDYLDFNVSISSVKINYILNNNNLNFNKILKYIAVETVDGYETAFNKIFEYESI